MVAFYIFTIYRFSSFFHRNEKTKYVTPMKYEYRPFDARNPRFTAQFGINILSDVPWAAWASTHALHFRLSPTCTEISGLMQSNNLSGSKTRERTKSVGRNV